MDRPDWHHSYLEIGQLHNSCGVFIFVHFPPLCCMCTDLNKGSLFPSFGRLRELPFLWQPFYSSPHSPLTFSYGKGLLFARRLFLVHLNRKSCLCFKVRKKMIYWKGGNSATHWNASYVCCRCRWLQQNKNISLWEIFQRNSLIQVGFNLSWTCRFYLKSR